MVIIDDQFTRDIAEYVAIYLEDLSMCGNLGLVLKFKDHEYLRSKCFLEAPFDWYATSKGLKHYEEMRPPCPIYTENQLHSSKSLRG